MIATMITQRELELLDLIRKNPGKTAAELHLIVGSPTQRIDLLNALGGLLRIQCISGEQLVGEDFRWTFKSEVPR